MTKRRRTPATTTSLEPPREILFRPKFQVTSPPPTCVDWGELYGRDPYQTDDGRLVWMFRRHLAVRFYDERGNQVGPEQRNVAPAVCYAIAHRWDLNIRMT
jgi:hypothetical protein